MVEISEERAVHEPAEALQGVTLAGERGSLRELEKGSASIFMLAT